MIKQEFDLNWHEQILELIQSEPWRDITERQPDGNVRFQYNNGQLRQVHSQAAGDFVPIN
ncbi:MAG: hypothetical protein A2W28_02695 [Gammaproteobacteria bacterium RBG_16_51_14]|nr:MAG: hypothetical protein A2W28_02695 [Gammaproteobacteria bacterium RBG_16_51_14]